MTNGQKAAIATVLLLISMSVSFGLGRIVTKWRTYHLDADSSRVTFRVVNGSNETLQCRVFTDDVADGRSLIVVIGPGEAVRMSVTVPNVYKRVGSTFDVHIAFYSKMSAGIKKITLRAGVPDLGDIIIP